MSDYRALLLTDVVDSTKLAERLGNSAMAEVWAAHDRVARDLLRGTGGREIDKTDGMLFMFDHAVDAVDYALAYQASLASLPVPLSARAGVHVGPVILRENSAADVALGAKPLEVEGLSKPIAARVMALAQGGQVLLTAAAREALGKTRLRVVCHGHWSMKGLAEPIEVFEAGDYEAAFQPPVAGEKARRVVRSGERWIDVDDLPGNLPQQATRFIGREREVREIKDLLGTAHLVTLVGMGGLGKTRLALQVAAELRHRYADGTWFVDLAGVRDPALVTGEAAQALGVREEPDRPLIQTLCAYLRSRTTLLILDNCEHLLAATAQLAAAVVRAASGVTLLATSREPMHAAGEQVYPVLPLPVPERDATIETLLQTTAVRLFIDRVKLQKPAFELSEREAPAVAELVARLEGIPLAMELAAARVRALSVADINARLSDRYKLLTAGSRVALERQQTLRALVDWSFDLLDEPEQLLLQRLAVFAGGFDLAAAESVCGAEPLAADEVLDRLGSLVEKSLVMLDEGASLTRYRMLETIRDYARDKLERSGQRQEMARRHCEHFFALAKSLRDGLNGADQADWIRSGEADLDNLRAALSLALHGEVDPFIAVKMAVALQGLWTLRGYVGEGREVVRSLLALPAICDSDLAHAHALYVGAALAYCQSDHRQAQQMLETCLQLRRRLGDPLYVAGTLSTLAMARLQAADAQGAAACESEALEIFGAIGYRIGEAISLLHLGQIEIHRGDDSAARSHLEQALAIAREVGQREVEGECELVLGQVEFEAGALPTALARLTRSLEICRAAADRRGEGLAIWWLARVDLASGRLGDARGRLREALLRFRAFEMREELLGCLEDHAALALADGAPAMAARLAGSVAASRERLGLARAPRHALRWQLCLDRIGAAHDSVAELQAALAAGRNEDPATVWRDAVAATG